MAASTRMPSPFPPSDPRTPKVHNLDPNLSPKSSGPSPRPLTGAGAMADMRKRKATQSGEAEALTTSPNPGAQAMQSLLGGDDGTSRPSDAPKAPTQTHSPSSYVTTEATGSGASSLTATANDSPTQPGMVAEPAQMRGNLVVTPEEQDGSKAFSYPGPPPQVQERGAPSRGMSLPGYGQSSPKSPASSNKRHKCPYCSTDFTRHHNLKSHLLTHSQEKPYVCQTCSARFRRLHDLKRHTKLHTGERPHICEKCNRRFARGDALARHNKGPGGCAGRRSSFGGDEDYGEDGPDGMDGVEYNGEDPDEGSPDPSRRASEPSRKRAHVESGQDPSRDVYRQQSTTYPPPRPFVGNSGSMGPPQVVLSGSNATDSPREMSNQPSPAIGSSMSAAYHSAPNSAPNSTPSQVFPQQPSMTESPTPISPGQPSVQHRLSVGDASGSSARNRSPSLTTQMQQANFGRGSIGSIGRTPSGPPTQFATTQHAPPPVPVLPPLTSSQPAGRPGFPPVSATSGPGPSMLHHQQVPSLAPQQSSSGSNTHPLSAGGGSQPGSLSSHGQSSGGSMRDIIGADTQELWKYVRDLEKRFARYQDETELRASRQQEEIISLRMQVANPHNAQAGAYAGEGQHGGRY